MRSRRRMGACSIAVGDSRPAPRKFKIARSTFVHDVFWVRIAPTIASNCVLPGHQCWGPNAVKRELKYSSRGGRPLAAGRRSSAGSDAPRRPEFGNVSAAWDGFLATVGSEEEVRMEVTP